MSKIIGIDLGTTNSCVSVVQQGKNTIIPNQQGGRTTPSIVAFKNDGDRLLGQTARRQSTVNPKNTISSVKRLMGLSFDDAKKEIDNIPYSIKKSDKGQANVYIQNINKQFTPQEISAMIIGKMKQIAEQYLGERVQKAIITVPAYFNDDQRTATKDAGRIAGLQVMRIINEPTAAALAYGVQGDKNKKIAVYDFGGGTFDISILDLFDGLIQVLSTNGDTHLGGDDVDRILMNYIIEEFKKENGIDLKKDAMALQRVKEAAQKAKIELSGVQNTNINLPFISANSSGPLHLSIDISLAKFQSMIQPIVNKTIEPCKIALRDAKLTADDIDEVLLVGGSTRIPLVQKIVKQIFKKQPSKSINPDEAVAAGAAIQGAILSGDSDVKDLLLLDVTPLSLGIQTVGGVFTKLIDKNTTIPTKKSEVFSTASDNQSAVTIHVLQGQRTMANDNKSLGKFDLVGIPPAPRGMPQIQVTFDIDANGIIGVSAKDKGTGKQHSIRIDRAGQLSDSDIEQMIKEAQSHKQQDDKRKKLIEANNNLQGVIYQGLKQVEQYSDKLPENIKQQIINILNENKDKTYDTVEQAQNKVKQITEKLQNIGKYIYQGETSQEPN